MHLREEGVPLRLRRAAFLICCAAMAAAAPSPARAAERAPAASSAAADGQKTVLDTSNSGGTLRTTVNDGGTLDTNNPFFQSLGSNGRACASCHVPSTGWTISPQEVQQRFNKTDGLDPIFSTNDGSNSPRAGVSTTAARRTAFSMLLNKAVIRVGLPLPRNAEFELVDADDPYDFASDRELSLFRRPLPASNLHFLTTVMWDGRESYGPMGTEPIRSDATPEQNSAALFADLMHQANDATVGHAEGAPLTPEQQKAIVRFETSLATAQQTDRSAGMLEARGARGVAAYLAAEFFYVTINDVLGGDVVSPGKFEPNSMTLFDAWTSSSNPRQAAIARGARLFGAVRFDITAVGGLNDELNARVIRGSCSTCHDTPNVGNHSVALPIDIGLTDASRRTKDMPLYTLRNRNTGEIRQTTDPGRAMLTGLWKDIGKFKGPILRGLVSRAPYFHDGQAADLAAVIDFYDERFDIGFTEQE